MKTKITEHAPPPASFVPRTLTFTIETAEEAAALEDVFGAISPAGVASISRDRSWEEIRDQHPHGYRVVDSAIFNLYALGHGKAPQ